MSESSATVRVVAFFQDNKDKLVFLETREGKIEKEIPSLGTHDVSSPDPLLLWRVQKRLEEQGIPFRRMSDEGVDAYMPTTIRNWKRVELVLLIGTAYNADKKNGMYYLYEDDVRWGYYIHEETNRFVQVVLSSEGHEIVSEGRIVSEGDSDGLPAALVDFVDHQGVRQWL